MTEPLNQKISQLLDDDLSREEALDILMKLQKQPVLQRKMRRYEAISHALKAEAYIPIQPGFAQAIAASIDEEPVSLPMRRPLAKPSFWMLPALAASLMAVAVLMPQETHRYDRPPTKPVAIAGNNIESIMLTEPAAPVSMAKVETVETSPAAASRLNKYLQAHNSSRYIDGSANLYPYARVVSYNQE
ncbi:MAG: hypothetical protein CVV13_01820 [Gammaproteobacteria bacterium HGW-Gammaproteobacteria-3]|nr:MAG: hypothetical protein CVV13_01820 [Gammaproteobacteria bacterium HGW-Gammaproteobacteria-3]